MSGFPQCACSAIFLTSNELDAYLNEQKVSIRLLVATELILSSLWKPRSRNPKPTYPPGSEDTASTRQRNPKTFKIAIKIQKLASGDIVLTAGTNESKHFPNARNCIYTSECINLLLPLPYSEIVMQPIQTLNAMKYANTVPSALGGRANS